MSTWEESVFCCFWMECPINISKSILSNVSFKACVSLFIFILDDLSIGESGVLKSPTMTVLPSISPFMAVIICLMYVGCINMYNCYIFFLDWSLDHYVVSFFVSCISLYLFYLFFFLQYAGLSLLWPLLLRSTGSGRTGSAAMAHGISRSAACGIFPDRGMNPCPLHRQADSQPLRHQGSPTWMFLFFSSIFSLCGSRFWVDEKGI